MNSRYANNNKAPSRSTRIRPETSAQRRFDELSRRQQEAAATPTVTTSEESETGGMSQSHGQPSAPTRRSQHVPQPLTMMEPPTVQWTDSSEATPPDPPAREVPTTPGDAQIPDLSSPPVRLSRSQKYKARKAAKRRAQEALEEVGDQATYPEVTEGAS